MKSRNRYMVAFWIAAAMVIGLGVAMVAVLSAFQANTAGGKFSISYTAYHVNAEMTAGYKAPGTSAYTLLQVKDTTETTMVFNESESATKTFKDAPALNFTRDNKTVVLRYTIKNTATAESNIINVTENFTGPTTTGDIAVKYAALKDASDPTTWKDDANSALEDKTTIDAGETLYFYVQITLTSNTGAASFTGAFNFRLDAVDAN